MAERDGLRSFEKALLEKFVLVGFSRNFACETPHVHLALTRDTAAVTKATGDSFELNVLNARLDYLSGILVLLATLGLRLTGRNGTIEEFNQSEVGAGLATCMAQGKSAPVAAREQSVHVGADHGVD